MNIFKTLLYHEMRLQSKSFKFIILILITLIISSICGYVQVKYYSERQKNYVEEIEKANNLKKNLIVYSDFKIPVFNKPISLSIIARGYNDISPNKVVVSPLDLPIPESTSQAVNPLLNIFVNLDITGIIIYILSITALLVSAGNITAEKEDNTLKLLFANSISRTKYFLVKYLGSLILVAIALAFIFMIICIIIILCSNIELDLVFILKLFGIFLSSVMYLSIYILFGLLISSFSSSTGSSVINALFLWVILIFIYPNTISYIVKDSSKYATNLNLDKEIETKTTDFIKEHMKWKKENSFEGINWGNKGDFGGLNAKNGYPMITGFPLKYAICSNDRFAYYKEDLDIWLPKLWNCQDEIMKLHYEQKRIQLKQERIISSFTCFLPDLLFRTANETIACSSRKCSEEDFINNVKIYRTIINDYLVNKNAFGYKFFTPIPSELMANKYEDYSEETLIKYGQIRNVPKINLDDMPVFSNNPKSIFPIAIIGILLINIVLLIIGIYFFLRMRII